MSRKVEYIFDPFEITNRDPLPKDKRAEALDDISNFVLESVLQHVGESTSPVSGRYGKFQALSKAWKAKKEEEGGTPIPNLEFTGSMLSALECNIKGGKLVLRIKGSESDKADGHNNHSGESKIPTRRFIPLESDGETFKKEIINGIKTIIDTYEE